MAASKTSEVSLACSFTASNQPFLPRYARICAQNRSAERSRRSLGGLKHLQLNRQLFTAFAATGLEHLSPAFSTPAGPKAVHLFATSLLGLIGSFRHDVLSSLGMNMRQDIIPCFTINCKSLLQQTNFFFVFVPFISLSDHFFHFLQHIVRQGVRFIVLQEVYHFLPHPLGHGFGARLLPVVPT
jgi:hypothetical protein